MRREIILGLGVALSTSASAAPAFTYIDLGALYTPAGSFSSGRGVSSNGRGVFYTAGNNNVAYTWTQGGGVVQQNLLTGNNQARVESVNDSGFAVGNVQNGSFGTQRPTFWVNGTPTLYSLPDGIQAGRAYRVNNANVAVGSINGGSLERAVTYSNGLANYLPSFADGTPLITAYDINSSGLTVGHYWASAGTIDRPFVYTPFASTPIDIGLLSGDNSGFAWAVNNAGVVVGTSSNTSAGTQRAYKWTSASGMSEIAPPTAGDQIQPRAINNNGWVVGQNFTANAAFLYDGTATYTLNTLVSNLPSGVSIQSALGVSDGNIIIGQTQDTSGLIHAYALVPVPEPATMAVLGLGVLVAMRRRRKSA